MSGQDKLSNIPRSGRQSGPSADSSDSAPVWETDEFKEELRHRARETARELYPTWHDRAFSQLIRRSVDALSAYQRVAGPKTRDELLAYGLQVFRLQLHEKMRKQVGGALVAEVADLREAGATWTSIGHLLDMSKQAANQRFSQMIPRERDQAAWRASEFYERTVDEQPGD